VKRTFQWRRRGAAELGRGVDEEIAFHIDMRAGELEAGGVPRVEARRQAEREFGDVGVARAELIADDARAERRRTLADTLVDGTRDLRIAVRGLLRAPGFLVVAVATLAIGIGATTALFSVVDGVLLKPLPYADPDRLVAVSPDHAFLRAEYALARERARSFEALAGYRSGVGFSVVGAGEPMRLVGAVASSNLFTVLGTTPAFGRGFTDTDEQPGAEPVVLLSHGLWQEHFAGERGVLGSVLSIDGVPHTVIGVMPRRFGFPSAETRLWVPLVLDPAEVGSHWGVGGVNAVARLAPGVTADGARQEMVGLADPMRLGNPLWTPNPPYRADLRVVPLAERVTGDAGGTLLLLLGATAFLLLIACANVGNLYMVRVLGRERDLAVRAALGGGRPHIVRAILAESGVIALAGGVLGVALGYALLGALLPLLPPGTPRLEQVALDGRVLGFTVAITAAAALLFSLLPLLRMSAGRLQMSIREGGRGGGEGRAMRRVTRGVVVAEVALAVALLLGASLLIRSLGALHAIDPGFGTEGAVAARLSPPAPSLPDRDARLAFYDRVLARAEALPGVTAAAVAGQLPFDGERIETAAAVEHVTTDPNNLPVFDFRAVTPGVFSALAMPVLDGRAFNDADRAGALPVAIIDQAAADRFWPGESPIGRRIGRPWMNEWLTIVGVVPTVRNNDLLAEPVPALYVPFAQQPTVAATLVVRGGRPVGATAAALRAAVREVDPSVPVTNVRSLGALVGESVAGSRALALLLSLFAGVALLLGALGVYGVLAFSVQRRARELGVRLALGATAAEVRRLVLREGAVLVLAGIALGVPAALALAGLAGGLLYGVGPLDPVSIMVAPLLLGAAGLGAAWLPARRAARVEPAETLR
jgi:putative ABC transport system permease protein